MIKATGAKTRRPLLSLILTILIISVTLPAHCQPAVDSLWLYDNNQSVWDMFADVYRCDNGDFLLCGQTNYRPWVLRIDAAGAVLWSYVTDGVRLFSVIEADNGDAVAVGSLAGGNCALRLDGDGQLVWNRGYGVGRATGIIELKEGDFILCGRGGELVRIQGNGDAVWHRSFHPDTTFNNFEGLRETNDGIVATGGVGRSGNGWFHPWEMVSTANGFALVERLCSSLGVKKCVTSSHSSYSLQQKRIRRDS